MHAVLYAAGLATSRVVVWSRQLDLMAPIHLAALLLVLHSRRLLPMHHEYVYSFDKQQAWRLVLASWPGVRIALTKRKESGSAC